MAFKKGFVWTTLSTFAKAKSRKPNKQEIAEEKLLAPNSTRGYLGGVTQMAAPCGCCKHFAACVKLKGVREDTAYCQYREGRFEGKYE